ncbi:Multimodular transpeptidase-transglycosylase, partial [hydrothermal vent metagenome]
MGARARRWLIPVLAMALVAISLRAFDRVADRLYPPPLERISDLSTEIVDRNGRLLRAFANSGGRWRFALDLDRLDPRFIDLLLAYEDRRFWRHGGVDIGALARAAWQFVSHGKIVSGGSTITMQLARLIEPRPRTFAAKAQQIWRAIQIERRLTKRQILGAYLTLAPYGGNLEGLRAAALAYFGRGVGHLPPAQAALLVALPQSPEARRPDRFPLAAKTARTRVLARAVKAGVLSAAEAAAATLRPMTARRRDLPALAAHEAARLAGAVPGGTALVTHLDAALQSELEALARARAGVLGAKASVAIVVAEHGSGRIRARVGSPDPFDGSRLGPIDMTRAVRSPGSVLKPFIYGLAFEAGIAHPKTLIDDRPTDFSGYAPRNFDSGYQGTITMAEALTLSLNIPAVKVLQAVGPTRFMSRLTRAGATPKLPENSPPGLGVALGGLGVSLIDSVGVYAALARGGEPVGLHSAGAGPAAPASGPVLGPLASWYVTDILTKTPPPEAALRGRIAYKTGTSYGYRDAWAIGFDGRYVIGVWAGRPDGTPISGLSGLATAAPILWAAFARIEGGIVSLPGPPDGVITAGNLGLPAPMRRFGAGASVSALSLSPLTIAFPPQG